MITERTFILEDALVSLRPNASWVVRDGVIEWLDTEQTEPTAQEIADEIVSLQEDYDAKQYQRDRAAAYPDIGEQLDALFHAGVFPDEMAAKIQAVKDANPKPE